MFGKEFHAVNSKLHCISFVSQIVVLSYVAVCGLLAAGSTKPCFSPIFILSKSNVSSPLKSFSASSFTLYRGLIKFE
jgi:hypothetical protein